MNTSAGQYDLNRIRNTVPPAWMYSIPQLDPNVRRLETLTGGVSAALHQSLSGHKVFHHWVVAQIGISTAIKTEMKLARVVFGPGGGLQKFSEVKGGRLHYAVRPEDMLADISISDAELSVWSYKRTVFLNTGVTTGEPFEHARSFVLNVLDTYAGIVERKFDLSKSLIP